MATGDQDDFVWRLRQVLPARWFPDDAPVLDSVLSGLAAGWAAIYSQITYTAAQARIATATDGFLDMAAVDYLGGALLRKPGQSDAAFSAKLRAEIIRPRLTRASIVQVLTDLTGRAPVIFEPANVSDTGGWGYQGMTAGTAFAYANSAGVGGRGAWGSLDLPCQVFITAYRSTVGGIANVGGYYGGSGWAGGGYGVGAIEWTAQYMNPGQITDDDIYAAVASVMPVGGIGWVRISN